MGNKATDRTEFSAEAVKMGGNAANPTEHLRTLHGWGCQDWQNNANTTRLLRTRDGWGCRDWQNAAKPNEFLRTRSDGAVKIGKMPPTLPSS